MDHAPLAGSVRAVSERGRTIAFDYDLSLFSAPSSRYNHELARLACALVYAGYDRITDDPTGSTGFPYTQKCLKETLDQMGFTAAVLQPKAARDEESYFLAFRELELDGRRYDLFVSASIGSYNKTWFSDFDPLGVDRVCRDGKGYAGDAEKGAIHLGFADARDFVFMHTRDFILKHRTGNPVKLLLTGHSRGGATAGLIAAKVIDAGGLGDDLPIEPDDLYAYCFASPNYADIAKTDAHHARYARIFNISSPEDFVTQVFPKACGFGKYGAELAFFGRDNRSRNDYAREKTAMARFFGEYRPSRPYVCYKDGNRTVERIVRMVERTMSDMSVFYSVKARFCFRKVSPFDYFKETLCPVVGGNESPEDALKIARAQKLLFLSAVDLIGTCRAYRKVSAFFVFKQGLGAATGGKLGKEYFNDAHVIDTYRAYMMALREDQMVREP